ncbi:MAG: 2Fe-2S iron-sulfur cluster-binding protein, partial [Candidatus Bathyarchaeia archaeon]
MSEKKFVTLNVYRYNPDMDNKPRHETYKIPYTRGLVVLDALNYIHENLDSAIAYRWNCGTGQCGGCSVMINNTPGLACRTMLE